MNIYALLALNFIPLITVFLILCVIVKGFKFRYALLACILGLTAVFPTSFIQYFVLSIPVFNTNTFASVLITAIIFNGLIEETVKMLLLCFIPQKRMSLGIFFCCCLLAGLTTGCIESVIYILKKIQEINLNAPLKELVKLIMIRAFTSVLIHTFCSCLSGLYLWLFRHKMSRILPFIYAVLLHGVYNFFAGFNSNYRYLSIVAILFALLECRIWYRECKSPEKTENI